MRPPSPLLSLSLLPLLGACSATPDPVTPAPPVEAPPVASEAPPAAKAPCPSKEACFEAAHAASKAGDKDRAKELYRAGCDLESGPSCMGLAGLLKSEPDKSVELMLRACKLGTGTGCLNAAEELRTGPRGKEALELYARACKAGDAPSASLRGLACKRGVRWKMAGGWIVDAKASAGDDKKVEGCVEKVVKSSTATFDATCRASFKLGRAKP